MMHVLHATHPLAWQVVFENSGDAYDHSHGNQQYLLTDSETTCHCPSGMWQQHAEQLYPFHFLQTSDDGLLLDRCIARSPGGYICTLETLWQLRAAARAFVCVDIDAGYILI